MTGRRKAPEEHESHERWLVSYADFITLLFAFFVVMYAISSVNEGKYRVLSDSLVAAFRNVPGEAGGAQVNIRPPMTQAMQQVNIKPAGNPRLDDPAKQAARGKMRNVAREIMAALAPLVKNGQVRVTEGARGVTVEINASVLFAPGDARLGAEAVRALTAVAAILAPADYPVIVEGHTDDTPIATAAFPSNWELSGMRASSVVRLFIDRGVAPGRLTATGYADQRPVADNATAAGRARNRRVAITLEAQTPDNVVEVPVSAEEATRDAAGGPPRS